MSKSLQEVRQNSAGPHTVFVIYENGKPWNNSGRIAYERESDAKSQITSVCKGEARRKTRWASEYSPEFKAAVEEARKRFKIVPYTAKEEVNE